MLHGTETLANESNFVYSVEIAQMQRLTKTVELIPVGSRVDFAFMKIQMKSSHSFRVERLRQQRNEQFRVVADVHRKTFFLDLLNEIRRKDFHCVVQGEILGDLDDHIPA